MSNYAYSSLMLCILIFTFQAQSKHKFEINRCTLKNGTISFQEQPCKKSKKYTLSKKKQIRQKKKAETNNTPRVNANNLTYKIIDHPKASGYLHQLLSHRVGRYQISITTLKNWITTTKVYSNKLLHMKFVDHSPNNRISLLIDFIFPDGKQFSLQELTNLINLVGSRYVTGSREHTVNIDRLKVKQGLGVMAIFTNSQIVKDYKFVSKGVIFKKDWMIQFTLLGDNTNSTNYRSALISLLDTISIKK